MKIRYLNFSLIITAFVFMLISGCSNVESPDSPEVTATNNVKSLSKDPAEIQEILTQLQQNNIEQAAFFFDVTDLSFGFGTVDFITGENAFFFGTFGNGDFLRMNPDGTYSVKLVTNQADAFTIDFTTGRLYRCTGTGHMNYIFSGTGYTIIPGVRIFMIRDPNLKAAVIDGHATVYDVSGTDPNPHTVLMTNVSNPGGQFHFQVIFN